MKHTLLKLLVGLILLLGLCWGIIHLYLISRPPAVFPLKLKWQIELGSSTYERPTYQDGLVLFPANGLFSSHWYGLEATTGEVVWSQRVRRNSYRRCLTEEYLVLSGPSSFITLKISSGEIAWIAERAETATCSEEMVFSSGVPRDSIHAFDLSTGQQLWGITEPPKSFSTMIYNFETDELIAGGAVIVAPNSGKILRSFEPSFVGYAPGEKGRGDVYVVDRGELFIGGTVRDAQTGEVIHKEDRYSTNFPPTVTENMMYLSSGYEVVAFDRANYNVKWVYSPGRSAYAVSPVAILDGVGYIIYSDATLRAIDLESGQLLGYWRSVDLVFWSVCGTTPTPGCVQPTGVGMAASDDTLFVSFGDGKLHAFGE